MRIQPVTRLLRAICKPQMTRRRRASFFADKQSEVSAMNILLTRQDRF